ncbi:3-isopropylmalate dehydrogenase [Lentisphaera marina]|uniref:3-isopropylmalate dehydrogenase n=1 Tax=Lentisphaera marina TaxID=1111041 RepID=UPI0023673FF3|nr:3-isopropylmalate dehydrogenase [Lentisphaera marina]MDD7983583.1 3-isopropylmalate dehydrogenase [Lentisphaera marina]
MDLKICVLPGDGIGPEIIEQAVVVLEKVCEKFGHNLTLDEAIIGGASIDAHNTPLTQDTIDKCLASDAVLMGAIGGPKWDKIDKSIRPERGLLGIRKALGLYANLRPAKLWEELKDASFLKDSVIGDGLDIMVVRELIGGIYFGEPRGEGVDENGERYAYNTMVYKESEVKRIVKLAFEIARKRGNKLHSVEKANVLDVSQLWNEVAEEVAKDYTDVDYHTMYVDNAAMQLVRNPGQFDTIVTGNLFGDIISDEASMITGSIGMLPSASIGDGKVSLYEPIHGSAPDITGTGKANPLATILSVSMMLRYSFDLDTEADLIEDTVAKVLAEGYRTADIMEDGKECLSCSEMGALVASKL